MTKKQREQLRKLHDSFDKHEPKFMGYAKWAGGRYAQFACPCHGKFWDGCDRKDGPRAHTPDPNQSWLQDLYAFYEKKGLLVEIDAAMGKHISTTQARYALGNIRRIFNLDVKHEKKG